MTDPHHKPATLFKKTKVALNGLKILFQERAAQYELGCLGLTLFLYIKTPSPYSFTAVILACILLATEAVNTSLEKLCDHVTPQYDEAIKSIKDCASSGTFLVILALVFALIVHISTLGEQIKPFIHLGKKLVSIARDEFAEYSFFIGSLIIAFASWKHKRKRAIFFSILPFLWIFYFKSINSWIQKLGIDSITETQHIDTNEAVFYLRTLASTIKMNFTLHVIIYTPLALAFYYGLKRWVLRTEKSKKNLPLIGYSLVLLAIIYTCAGTIRLFINDRYTLSKIEENFHHTPPQIEFKNKDLLIVVYIGESTSVMNMGLYGYFRDTTPRLSDIAHKDNGFILFQNVFSTHTHTSQSLLEAFSIGLDKKENILPINDRQRLSLVDTFAENGIQSYFISNQQRAELGNFLPKIIFSRASIKYSQESAFQVSPQHKNQNPYDDVFFKKNLESIFSQTQGNQPIAVFLHSYAGHGPYLNNIPSLFHNSFDAMPPNPKAVWGDSKTDMASMGEDYDRAIRYIDASVTESLTAVKNLKKPAIFIYFSDHGDSVYTGYAHDSSRFVHEMARVPFIIYFNKAAQEKYSRLFAQYKERAKHNKLTNLSKLPSTLLDLFGATSKEPYIVSNDTIGAHQEETPIVIRETSEGYSYVNLTTTPYKPQIETKQKLIDATDEASKVFAATQTYAKEGRHICYHRANTLAKARRGSLTASCLEIDIVVEDNDTISVRHPPVENVGLMLDDMMDLAQKNNLALWLDSKNLNDAHNCQVLANSLDRWGLSANKILIEFPHDTSFDNQELQQCAHRLKQKGYRTSFYLPMQHADACAKDLEKGLRKDDIMSCTILHDKLEQAHKSGMFSDFSFDYSGIIAMESLSISHNLRWNSWGVSPEKIPQIHPERFGMLILSNRDPNNL